MQRLSGVLLQMKPLDAHLDRVLRGQVDLDLALAHNRTFILRDLIALRQVRIEVVLAIEDRAMIDPSLKTEASANRLSDAFAIDNREHAWHRGVNERHIRVGRSPERGRSARE